MAEDAVRPRLRGPMGRRVNVMSVQHEIENVSNVLLIISRNSEGTRRNMYSS